MGIARSPDGTRVYVTTGRGGSIAVLDAATGRVTARFSNVGARPWGIGVSGDGKLLYTANGPSDDVSVVDASTGKVLRRIPNGGSPWGIAVAPR